MGLYGPRGDQVDSVGAEMGQEMDPKGVQEGEMGGSRMPIWDSNRPIWGSNGPS